MIEFFIAFQAVSAQTKHEANGSKSIVWKVIDAVIVLFKYAK